MQFSQSQFALTLASLIGTVGLLCTFFLVLLIRYFRTKAKQQRDLLRAMIETEENERRRIAEDMHDGLGQLLAAAKLQADALRHAPPDQLIDNIATVKETLDHASVEVRNVVQDLVPRKLEDDGFYRAVENLSSAVDASSGLRLRVETHGQATRFDARAELMLYRIVQELVANAVKHAGATELLVSVHAEPQRLSLSVTDNGVGFNPDAKPDGNGLHNVRSRTAWLKGNVRWLANTPSGTRVELSFDGKNLTERS